MMNKIQLLIRGAGGKVYEPILLDEITWETGRLGVPGKLTFTVVKDDVVSFPEGAQVQLKVNGQKVFIGFVFQKSRDKEHHIECVAYDQLRYLKNKDCYVYTNKKASDLVKMIADDFNLTVGVIEDTGYPIPKYAKGEQSLIDTILDALSYTTGATGNTFVLYDDFGKITLKSLESMKVNTLIDPSTAENFDYKSSIDSDTYNMIKVVRENAETGKDDTYVAVDWDNVGNWGILQLFERIEEGANGDTVAKTLLELKNRKTRNLTVNGCFGDFRVRGGSSLPIHLYIGDVNIQSIKSLLVCDKVVHHISAHHHSMDLTLYDAHTFVGG